MIEEEQDAKTDADGVGDFQGGIAGCGLAGDLGVELLEKGGNVYVVVKGPNGKACAEKGGEADEDDFAPSYNNINSSFFFICDDEGWFSNMRNVKIRLFSWISWIRSITEITYRPGLSGLRFATDRTRSRFKIFELLQESFAMS